jgi:DNA-binding PadR family transcriptional regulator
MSISFAILGLLSWKPSTGYELKKIFEESSTMYWSGNNNQIYKSLIQLLKEGLVTNEIQHQESSPSKKIYTITEEGLAELKEWVLSNPEPPEFKKMFLIQLAWADQLNTKELNGLLSSYENEIKMQLLLQQEKNRRGQSSPSRSPREVFLWDMISENLTSSLKNELDWVEKVRYELIDRKMIEEKDKMNHKVIENGDKKYIEVISVSAPFYTEQDALDLVALCGEHDTNLLMLHESTLSDDFFKLKTGVAGRILQKLINYRVKTAAVISDEIVNKGKFKDMVSEGNKGNQFRVFNSREAAENWLLS